MTAGKLQIIDLLTSVLPHIANGQDGLLNFNAVYPAWNWLRFAFPSQYGAGALLLNEDVGMLQAGFVVFGQDNVSTTWDISDSFSDGVGMIGFARHFWEIAELPGFAIVMAGGSTKTYNTIDGIDFDPGFPPGMVVRRSRGKPWAVTSFLSQDFWQGPKNSGRRAYAILAGSISDTKPSFARWGFNAIVEAVGPLASRPADRVGVAGWFNEFNNSLKRELGVIPGQDPGNLYGFELYYNIAINHWLHLTADLQLVQNTNKNDGFAVIPGARLVMDF